MSRIYITADPHLGHRSLPHFGYRNDRTGNPIKSCEQNTDIFIDEWEHTVKKKNDLVICMGDMAFDLYHHNLIRKLPGRKVFIKGNHDHLVGIDDGKFLETYESIEGTHKRYGMWFSHFPVHPAELWGKVCVHGHTHHANVLKPEAGADIYWQKHGDLRRETGKPSEGLYPWPAPKGLEDPRYLNMCPENTQLVWNKWIISLEEVREYFKNKEEPYPYDLYK